MAQPAFYPLGKGVISAQARYEEEWISSPFGNLEIFNQLWETANENTQRSLFEQGRMSTKPKPHAVDMARLLAPRTPSTCVIFALKVLKAMKLDGRFSNVTYMHTGSHGAVAVNNYILIDSSAAEVIKLWGKRGSFIKWDENRDLGGGKVKGTIWYRMSRKRNGYGWFQSDIIDESLQGKGHTYARETLFKKLSIHEMVQSTFNSAYTRNALIIFFRVANNGVLGFDQMLSLNFKRRELKFGNNTRKIEAGLSSKECAEIWRELACWARQTLSPGAYIQWMHVKQEFRTWYDRAIQAWVHGELGGDAITG